LTGFVIKFIQLPYHKLSGAKCQGGGTFLLRSQAPSAARFVKTTGALSVIAVLLLIMAVGEAVLPASFAHLFLIVTVIDCVVIIVLANTICKR